jgi:tetratricopeptide (TPR) repeat protein
MVTNKKSGASLPSSVVCAAVALAALLLGGCQPAGPKSLLLGEKYIEQGDYEKALKYLTRATVLIPEHPQVWNHLGLAYHGLQQPVKAVEAYQRAIRIHRNIPEPHYNLGMLLLEQHHYPQAIAELSTFVNLKTNSAAGWVKLGTAYLRLKRPDDAERALMQALRIDPKNPEAHNALGLAHVQRKRPREAVQSFNNSLQFDAAYAPAVLNQAIVSDQYFANKQLALERYRAFLSTKPEGATAARVQQAIGRIEAELAPPVAVAATLPQAQTNIVTAPAATNLASRNPSGSPTNVVTRTATNEAVSVAQTKVETNAPPVLPATQTNKTLAANLSTNRPAPPDKQLEKPPEDEPPLKVEVVRVNKEPEFKAPADLPAQIPIVPGATNVASATADIPETKPLLVSRRDRKDDDKEGILRRMNPGRWFRDKDKKDAPIAARTQTTPAPRPSYPPVVRNADPTPEPARLIARYQFRKKTPLKAGNRSEAEKFFRQGAEAHQERRYADAIEHYRNATNLDPTYFEAYYNLGIAAFQHKNLPLALSANELALAAKPASKEARYNFAVALREANYPADAANELRTLVTEEPDAERAHLALANLYAQQLDEPVLARRHYLAVLELNPNHPEAPLIRQWLASHP